MHAPVPYKIFSSYTHLSQAEAEIWTRFIAKYPDYFQRVWYDVVVGDIRGEIADLQPEWQRNAQYLGKYKIDVVGETEKVLWIVEIKKEATTKALGEVWLYEFLYKKDYEPNKKVETMIITDQEMPNIRECCESDNVKIFIV